MTMQEPELQQMINPQVLSPCSSGRRRSSDSTNSPEFEFWMVRNPSFPEPNLLSADELFSDGVLLPLHLLHQDHHPSSDDPPDPNQPPPPTAAETNPEPSGSDRKDPEPGSAPEQLSAPAPTSSKRWKDIFKKSDRRNSVDDGQISNREKKKKEKKSSGGVGAGGGGGNNNSALSAAAELNINIWPFSRSRSAGNSGTRPRMAAGATRKVSSAPCSRSNSAGESKSRKWPSSPSRLGGVHLGRSSPVWQVRRGGGAAGNGSGGKIVDLAVKKAEKCGKKEGNLEYQGKTAGGGDVSSSCGSGGTGTTKPKVLSLNVPMCIGYRHQLSCRSDENSAISVAAAAAALTGGGVDVGGGGGDAQRGSSSDEGIRGSNNSLFNFRGLFTKKVH